jgi:hypothetical protein
MTLFLETIYAKCFDKGDFAVAFFQPNPSDFTVNPAAVCAVADLMGYFSIAFAIQNFQLLV